MLSALPIDLVEKIRGGNRQSPATSRRFSPILETTPLIETLDESSTEILNQRAEAQAKRTRKAQRVNSNQAQTISVRAEWLGPLSLPLIIAHDLNRYLLKCKRKGHLDDIGPAGFNAMSAAVGELVRGKYLLPSLNPCHPD